MLFKGPATVSATRAIDLAYDIFQKNRTRLNIATKQVISCCLMILLPCLLITAQQAVADIKNPREVHSSLALTDAKTIYNINALAHTVHDPKSEWSVEDLLNTDKNLESLFQAPHSSIENTGKIYWLVFSVNNTTDVARWKLKFTHSRTDKIDVLVFHSSSSDSPLLLQGGLTKNSESREVYSLGHTFNLDLQPHSSYTIAIRAESFLFEGNLFVDLMTEDTYRKESRSAELVVLCTIGIMIALTLYNLFVFFGTHDFIYFWYSLYGASFVTSWATYFGFTWEITGYADPYRHLMSLSYMSYMFFLLMFTRTFLSLRQRAKKLDQCFILFLVLSSLSIAAIPFVHANIIFNIFWICAMPAAILCLISSYYVLRQGFRPARFLFLTHAILSLATSITWLSIADLVPYDVSLALFGKPTDSPAPTSFMVVGALEMLLLSLALADRIKKLHAEKQAAEEATKLKSTFLAIMSHEIRTPLNGVLSMVKLLAKTPLNEEQRKFTDNIDYSGNALLSLLNDVLDYSKMEHQQIELETISFDPKLLIDSMILLMSARASEKGLLLTAKLDDKLPRAVLGDPSRLRQILLNLVGNAIKFTEHGSVVVKATIISSDATKVKIHFVVVDTGIGIPESAQKSIFNIFSQADASITRRFGGSGLGLNICQRLVEAMGSQLHLQSKENTGSNFNFTLNFNLDNSTNLSPNIVNTPQRALNILLVDDVNINRVAGKGLLECEGHTVSLAANGIDALKAVLANNFDLILMDIHMPEMDGFETTQRIRSLKNSTKSAIPIIALTANAQLEPSDEYLRCGFTAVLSKPIEMEKLNVVLSQLTRVSDKIKHPLPTLAY